MEEERVLQSPDVHHVRPQGGDIQQDRDGGECLSGDAAGRGVRHGTMLGGILREGHQLHESLGKGLGFDRNSSMQHDLTIQRYRDVKKEGL